MIKPLYSMIYILNCREWCGRVDENLFLSGWGVRRVGRGIFMGWGVGRAAGGGGLRVWGLAGVGIRWKVGRWDGFSDM